MSEVKINSSAKVWAPPVFPVAGRLPGDVVTVTANYKRQTAEERCHQQGVNAKGQSQGFECCHSLHISLFFDGTTNNEFNDTKKNHPSNIAKLYHASLRGKKAEDEGYFSYYMPGVGTAFPEIGELDYSANGLRFATGGEDRINWALVQVASALSCALTPNGIDDAVAKNIRKHEHLEGTVDERPGGKAKCCTPVRIPMSKVVVRRITETWPTYFFSLVRLHGKETVWAFPMRTEMK